MGDDLSASWNSRGVVSPTIKSGPFIILRTPAVFALRFVECQRRVLWRDRGRVQPTYQPISTEDAVFHGVAPSDLPDAYARNCPNPSTTAEAAHEKNARLLCNLINAKNG
jgi:hypothetical protein